MLAGRISNWASPTVRDLPWNTALRRSLPRHAPGSFGHATVTTNRFWSSTLTTFDTFTRVPVTCPPAPRLRTTIACLTVSPTPSSSSAVNLTAYLPGRANVCVTRRPATGLAASPKDQLADMTVGVAALGRVEGDGLSNDRRRRAREDCDRPRVGDLDARGRLVHGAVGGRHSQCDRVSAGTSCRCAWASRPSRSGRRRSPTRSSRSRSCRRRARQSLRNEPPPGSRHRPPAQWRHERSFGSARRGQYTTCSPSPREASPTSDERSAWPSARRRRSPQASRNERLSGFSGKASREVLQSAAFRALPQSAMRSRT